MQEFRSERDTMGEMSVPDARYGASTMRAAINFPISTLRLPPVFIHTLGLIKRAAAEVNAELGLLDADIAGAITQAADEVAEGNFDDQFVVDVFQTGSGTSTNMNANEVIANRANDLLAERGLRTRVHANDHVNLGQSSNDVFPATTQIAALLCLRDALLPALRQLQSGLDAKAVQFDPVIKTARTHLQDATPIRLGQEFRGYAGQVSRALARIEEVSASLKELPLGGTAVGTGINTHPRFGAQISSRLSRLTTLELRETENHFQAQSNIDAVVSLSGELRAAAIACGKIANDIRWMGSGPRAGLGELNLPEVQPGSSIMPGKVNPVIAESLIQVCAQVIGNDAAIAIAGQGSYFELNLMQPVAAYNLLQAIELLAAATRNFEERCLRGLTATGRGPQSVENGLALATALAPVIGYDAAAAVAKEAANSGESILAVALRLTKLREAELRRILNPQRMLEPASEGSEIDVSTSENPA